MKRKYKLAKTEYTKSMLPQTRKEVFFDVLQLQWRSLLLLGLILLLFYLPLLLSTTVNDLYISNLYASLEGADDTAKMAAGQALVYLDIIRSVINILFIAVLAAGFSGICRVVRQYAWGENVHIPTDFARGIRDNFSHTAAIGALAGLIHTLCLTVYYTASSYSTSLLSALSLLPIAISALAVLPILALAIVMIPVYSNRLGATLKNAFAVYSRSLFKVLLSLGCCLLIWIPAMLPNFYCHIFGSIAAVLLTPYALLAWTLFCYDQFDKYINPIVCPQLVGKGIVWDTEASNQHQEVSL